MSSHLTACFTERSSTCLTHTHHFVPRHHRRHLIHCSWLESGAPHAPLRQQGCILAICLKRWFTQVMSPSPASTSAVSTRRSITPRGETAWIPTTTTSTVAASKNSDGFHQQAAASCSPQQVPASVVKPWLSADMWSSTRKPVRGNESIASVEGTLSRGKIEIWKVSKLCLKGGISMSTWSRKLNWLLKENAQLREDYRRLRQKLT